MRTILTRWAWLFLWSLNAMQSEEYPYLFYLTIVWCVTLLIAPSSPFPHGLIPSDSSIASWEAPLPLPILFVLVIPRFCPWLFVFIFYIFFHFQPFVKVATSSSWVVIVVLRWSWSKGALQNGRKESRRKIVGWQSITFTSQSGFRTEP